MIQYFTSSNHIKSPRPSCTCACATAHDHWVFRNASNKVVNDVLRYSTNEKLRKQLGCKAYPRRPHKDVGISTPHDQIQDLTISPSFLGRYIFSSLVPWPAETALLDILSPAAIEHFHRPLSSRWRSVSSKTIGELQISQSIAVLPFWSRETLETRNWHQASSHFASSILTPSSWQGLYPNQRGLHGLAAFR